MFSQTRLKLTLQQNSQMLNFQLKMNKQPYLHAK